MDIKNEIKYAFWMAFAFFIWWVIEYLIGLQAKPDELQASVIWSTIVIITVGMLLSMLDKKRRTRKEELSYGKLAIAGGISLVGAGILVLGLNIAFYKFVNTEWTQMMIDLQLDTIKEKNPEMSEGQIIEGLRAMYGAGSMGMQAFSRVVMLGLPIMLIEALIVLKTPALKNAEV